MQNEYCDFVKFRREIIFETKILLLLLLFIYDFISFYKIKLYIFKLFTLKSKKWLLFKMSIKKNYYLVNDFKLCCI